MSVHEQFDIIGLKPAKAARAAGDTSELLRDCIWTVGLAESGISLAASMD